MYGGLENFRAAKIESTTVTFNWQSSIPNGAEITKYIVEISEINPRRFQTVCTSTSVPMVPYPPLTRSGSSYCCFYLKPDSYDYFCKIKKNNRTVHINWAQTGYKLFGTRNGCKLQRNKQTFQCIHFNDNHRQTIEAFCTSFKKNRYQGNRYPMATAISAR